MKSCLPCEDLERLLTGDLPEEQTDSLHSHLAACPACRALLDRLSDDPELRRLASDSWPPAALSPDGPELTRALDRLRVALGVHTPQPDATTPPGGSLHFLGPPQQEGDLGVLGPYRVLAELGRGGMGIVLLAHDSELQRRVALKVMSPDRGDARACARFVREARASAGVEHEHVVPIHAVVSPPDGPPYLVMPYVEGPTLRDRIRAEGRLDPREAAQIAWQVAKGLAAAHKTGLVHRDVKPANILLDTIAGRAKITDFGLARSPAPSGGLTGEGTAPGTPEYMSPEQVREPGRPDVRTDVYGLGVTLYEALTGEVPFRGLPHLVLQQVLSEEPRRPRRLNDRVPRDLETICLKAMAKEPSRRYRTAADLADDLQRWLEGAPIRAWPVGPAGWLWCWCRRQPVPAALATALALVVVGSFAALTSLWLLAERNAEDARRHQEGAEASARQAEEQRRLADQRLRDARHSVHRRYLTLSEIQLAQEPGTQELRRKLLEEALEYFQDFLRQRPDDLFLQADVADAHGRVGRILSQIGPKDRALEEQRRARDLWGKLVARDPQDADFRHGLAKSYHDIGVLQREASRPAAALDAHRRAHDLFTELAQAHPDDIRFRRDLAASHNNLGLLRQEMGQPAEALHCYEQARALEEKLVQAEPNNAALQGDRARSWVNIAALRAELGEPAEAEKAYRQARDLLERLARSNQTEVRFQRDLAACHNNLGLLQQRTGRLSEALCSLQRALELREKLAQSNPAVLRFQANLAASHNNLGHLQREMGQLGEALRSYQQARAAYEKLIQTEPTAASYQSDLATTCQNLGLLHHQLREWGDALHCYERACGLLEKLVEIDPNHLGYHSRLGGALNSAGLIQHVLGCPDRAATALEQAVAQQRVAFEKAPQVVQYRAYLERHYLDLARLQRERGRPAEAITASLERQELWPRNPVKLYIVAADLALCIPLIGKGKAELTAEEQFHRRHCADRAIEVLRQAFAHGFKDLDRLKKDPDLDALRSFEAYEVLLIELQREDSKPGER